MAIIHRASLTPSKVELLAPWVPAQHWLGGMPASDLSAVGAYRFDDPDGEVGIETHLLTTSTGEVLQVPVTYRAAPLPGADEALIGTMQHSVLGERWVYDGCADPVYVTALATAILTGGTEAKLEYPPGTDVPPRPVTTRVVGSGNSDSAPPGAGSVTCVDVGTTTVVRSGDLELVVVRVVGSGRTHALPAGRPTLVGTWPGREEPTELAVVRTA